jgi:hypothetical protein
MKAVVLRMVMRMVRRRMKDMCCCWRWETVEERLEKMVPGELH